MYTDSPTTLESMPCCFLLDATLKMEFICSFYSVTSELDREANVSWASLAREQRPLTTRLFLPRERILQPVAKCSGRSVGRVLL